MRPSIPILTLLCSLIPAAIGAESAMADTLHFDTELEYPMSLEGDHYSFPRCIASGDVDLDGDIDLIVSDRRNYELRIMLNCGNGSFPHSMGIGHPTSSHHRIVRLRDLDADGDLDIVAAGPAARVHLNLGRTQYGDWLGFDGGHSYQAGLDPHWIESADIDGDGWSDLLVANYGTSATRTGWSLLLNRGTDGFVAAPDTQDPLFQRCLSITAVDLDLDSDLDVAVATQSGQLHLYENLGRSDGDQWMGTVLKSTLVLGGAISSIRPADLDADGTVDLVASHRSLHHFTIIANNGDWSLQPLELDCPPDGELVVPADIDGDGIPELSLLSRTTGSIHFYARQGNGDYAEIHATPSDADAQPKFLTHADLDGDGDTDYALVNSHPAIDGGSIKTGFNQSIPYEGNHPFAPCVTSTHTVDDDLPADFDTIQAAIDAAADGDEVIVMPGTYTGTGTAVADMLGKAVLLRASTAPAPVIIDGQSARRGMECVSGETHLSTIDGFVFVNCSAPDLGGGILCIESRPLIRNCTFAESCSAPDGAAVACRDSLGPRLINCTFESTATTAFDSDGCSVRLEHCLLAGGGVHLSDSHLELLHSTMSHHPGTALTLHASGADIEHCIFSENESAAIESQPGPTRSVRIGTSLFCQNSGGHVLGDWLDSGGNRFEDICSYLCPGDTNGDFTSNVLDMLDVLSHWGTNHPVTDLDHDGTTNVTDLLIVLSHWGPCD